MIRVYLDEDRGDVNQRVWHVLAAVERKILTAATSPITLAEVLPKPLAAAQSDLVHLHEGLLEANNLFDVMPITAKILGLAARIRASHPSLKLPDVIHLATAQDAACNAVFTGDKRLASPSGLPVVVPGPNSLDHLQMLAP